MCACVGAGAHACGDQMLVSGVFLDPSHLMSGRIFHCNTGFGDSDGLGSQFVHGILSVCPQVLGF